MEDIIKNAVDNTDKEQFDHIKVNQANIKVIGVGGAGNNMVTWLYKKGVKGAEIVACNTDQQHLDVSEADRKFLIGREATRGLGCGGYPSKGTEAAQESIQELKDTLKSADMVFVCAGMGGGTGTGAAPVVASIAKDTDAIVIGTVTMPFKVERARVDKAEFGLQQLRQVTDTVIVIDVIENDTIIHEIEKFMLIEKHKNDSSKLVHKIILKGLNETLAEIHHLDDTGDTLKIENKIEGGEKSYLDLHKNLVNSDGLKNYLQGKWKGKQRKTGKHFEVEYQGSSAIFQELGRKGDVVFEEITAANYEYNFIIRQRVMRGFPKEKIDRGKTFFRSLTILTKYQFRLGDKKGPIVFDKVL